MLNKLIGEVKGVFNIITIFELIIAFIWLIIGILFFVNPNLSNLLVSIFTGLVLIIKGVSVMFSYFKRKEISLFNYNLIFGIILILLGILSLFLGKVLSIILGIYMLVLGIQKINYGLLLKKFRETSWIITFVIGILFSIIAIITFFTKGERLIKAVGIVLIGYSIINAVNIILLRKRSNNFLS